MNSSYVSYVAESYWKNHPTGAAWPISLERVESDTDTLWVATYWDGTVVRGATLQDIDPYLNYEVLADYSHD